MTIDLAKATVEQIRIEFENGPHESDFGRVQWATVRIEFALPSLAPDMRIAVPVLWEDRKTLAEVRAEIFNGAVTLLKHLDLGNAGSEWRTEESSGSTQ